MPLRDLWQRREEDPLRRWDSLAERRIVEAMDAGAFDDLPGRGRPLDLRVHPYQDPATQIGYEILRGHGYSLPWIEEAADLDRERERAVAALRRAWEWSGPGVAWERAQRSFRTQIEALNRRVRDHNLVVPVPGMVRRRIDADAVIAEVTAAPAG